MERALLLVLLALIPGAVAAQVVAPPGAPQPAMQAPALPDAQLVPPVCEPGPTPIRLGLIPFLPETQLRDEMAPLVAHLSAVARRPVVVRVGADYADTIAFTVAGEVDLAYLTPACYVLARRQRPDLKLLLTDIRGGLDFYTAILLVRSEDGFDSLDDLRGKRIVFVDRESTSGYVFPLRYLAGLGLTPSDFGEARFSGNHRRSLEMLLAREADVAALSSNFLEGAREEGMDLSGTSVLARAGVIPQHAVVSTGLLPPDEEERLVEALLAITSLTPEGRALLPAAMRLNGWKRAEPEEFDDVERTLRGEAPSSRY